MFHVQLDHNEKIHGRADALKTALPSDFIFDGFADLPCDLLIEDIDPCGDDVATHHPVYVELKLIPDLWTSKNSGHLGEQIGKMTQMGFPGFVAVFGSVDEVLAATPEFSFVGGRKKYRDWKTKAIDMDTLRALSGDAKGCNIPIHYFSKNEIITFKFIFSYARNIINGPDIYQWLPHADSRYAAKSMLCMIPGIKNTIATTLLDTFGSVSNIANQSVEELQKIRGIGPSKAKKIYESFK